MKLIRWVEVHIGRSRRKNKKEKENLTGPDITRRKDESTPNTPLHKIEPIGKDLPRSAGSTPHHRLKHPPSPHPFLRAPETPSSVGGRLHIRTSFLDPGLTPPLSSVPQQALGFGSSTTLDTSSPRVRCRIRTNPWLPSPKNSANLDNGWNGPGGIRCSSIGSESSESIPGSGFGSQSSGSLWEGYAGDPWSGFRINGRSPSSKRLPRVILERSAAHSRRTTAVLDDEDTPYCPATYCRPIPRSAWIDFRELNAQKTTLEDEGESSDEAYSEDYVHIEEPEDDLEILRSPKSPPPDTGSPQADSACGSDRDNSSCSTTPLSETPAETSNKTSFAKSTTEMLQDKVQRLRRARHLVDERMKEARVEEIIRREEQLILQRELVQFRRLLLLQTLSELRSQLERRQGDFMRNNPEEEEEARPPDEEDEHWLQVQTELLG
ncbi:uncharacterized protein [Parasteatoda tepidariorum]|nr:uncharacterized protein LOC107453664 [Parasteatoda tepidariorum]